MIRATFLPFLIAGAVVAATALAGCANSASTMPIVSSKGVPFAASGRFSILHFFTGPPDGSWPDEGRLVFDKAGNVYGATYTGGSGDCRLRHMRVGCGTIFELRPRRNGRWSERIVYSFKTLADGASPYSTLSVDSTGNLYGVTIAGGNHGCLFWIFRGCGTAFELTPHGAGWEKRVLHVFSGGPDGGTPLGGLLLKDGTLYGTASCGGDSYSCYGSGSGAGVLFALESSGTQWTERILEVFTRTTGGYPHGDLTAKGRDTIYGATAGSIYMMTRSRTSGSWSETTLYLFPGNEQSKGYSPNGGLVSDAAGNLYGTAAEGGDFTTCSQGCGVAFKLSRSSATWYETVLHTFSGGGDGATPLAGFAIDAAGTLFGSTRNGGDVQCNGGLGCGVVYSLAAQAGERVLHTFEDDSTDGGFPLSGVTFDSHGSIYGSTWYGGPGSGYRDGTVYRITR